MAYWIVTAKSQESTDNSVSFMINGKPGNSKWYYLLQHPQTKQVISAVGTFELEVGTNIHEADISKVG